MTKNQLQELKSKENDLKNPDNDERMRIFANLIIDRILEDKKNGKLKSKELLSIYGERN